MYKYKNRRWASKNNVTISVVLLRIDIPVMSEFFLGNGGGFFNFPFVAFWASLLGLGASDMLVPVLEATEEAASLVNDWVMSKRE